jgi:protein SCO1/2
VTPGAQEADLPLRALEDDGLLILYLGYTHCPDVCPTTMADLKTALAELGPDADRVTVAMVTVDPERDTAEVLWGYVEFFTEGEGRALRTDDLDELREVEAALLTESSVTTNAEGEVEVQHSGTVHAVDAQGSVLVEWPFGVSAQVMADDLRALLDEIDAASDEGTDATDAADAATEAGAPEAGATEAGATEAEGIDEGE